MLQQLKDFRSPYRWQQLSFFIAESIFFEQIDHESNPGLENDPIVVCPSLQSFLMQATGATMIGLIRLARPSVVGWNDELHFRIDQLQSLK